MSSHGGGGGCDRASVARREPRHRQNADGRGLKCAPLPRAAVENASAASRSPAPPQLRAARRGARPGPRRPLGFALRGPQSEGPTELLAARMVQRFCQRCATRARPPDDRKFNDAIFMPTHSRHFGTPVTRDRITSMATAFRPKRQREVSHARPIEMRPRTEVTRNGSRTYREQMVYRRGVGTDLVGTEELRRSWWSSRRRSRPPSELT